jgi:hypothetical protein
MNFRATIKLLKPFLFLAIRLGGLLYCCYWVTHGVAQGREMNLLYFYCWAFALISGFLVKDKDYRKRRLEEGTNVRKDVLNSIELGMHFAVLLTLAAMAHWLTAALFLLGLAMNGVCDDMRLNREFIEEAERKEQMEAEVLEDRRLRMKERREKVNTHMSPENFCYWLQGHFELNPNAKDWTPEQVQMVRNHLNMVFHHSIDPKLGDAKMQSELQNIHDDTSGLHANVHLQESTVKPNGDTVETLPNGNTIVKPPSGIGGIIYDPEGNEVGRLKC